MSLEIHKLVEKIDVIAKYNRMINKEKDELINSRNTIRILIPIRIFPVNQQVEKSTRSDNRRNKIS